MALAKRAKVSQGYIFEIEAGQSKNPGIETLKKIAQGPRRAGDGAAGVKAKTRSKRHSSSSPKPAAGQALLEALYEVQAEVQALILLLVMKGIISPAELDAAIQNSREAMDVEKTVNPEIAASYAELNRLAEERRRRRKKR